MTEDQKALAQQLKLTQTWHDACIKMNGGPLVDDLPWDPDFLNPKHRAMLLQIAMDGSPVVKIDVLEVKS